MKITRLKRLTSAALAAMLLASSMAGMVAFAAPDYFLQFAVGDPGTETIIEGTGIDARSNIPTGSGFNPTKPFIVRAGGVEVTDKLGIQSSATKHTIKANPGSSGTNNPEEARTTSYILEPQLVGNSVVEGNGIAKVPVKVGEYPPPVNPGDPPEGTPILSDQDFLVEVESSQGLAFSEDSSFTFILNTGEENGTPVCDPIRDATGEFSTVNGASVVMSKHPTKPNVYTISFYDGPKLMKFDLTIHMPTGVLLSKNSKFTIKYSLVGTLNQLILHVISPQQAVNSIAASIFSTPTNPDITDSYKFPYVKLGQGDMLSSIGGNFEVLTMVQKYVYDAGKAVDISWAWVPEIQDDAHQNVLKFGTATRTQMVTVAPLQEDIKGHLVATVSYNYTDGTAAAVRVEADAIRLPITILGLGERPYLMEVVHHIGQDPPVTYPNPGNPTTPPQLPERMDLYKGDVLTYPQKPNDPYRVQTLLNLGSGRGKAEKLTIEVTSPTGTAQPLQIFVDGRSELYKPGTELDNTKGQMALEFVANQVGQANVVIKFKMRNAQNQLVESNHTISKKISVVDTSPKSFAEFANIELLAPDLVGREPYPDGRIDFGFKSDVYTYTGIKLPYAVDKIVLTPKIPVDKGVSTNVRYWVDNIEGTLNVNSGDNNSITVPLLDINTIRKVIIEAKAEDNSTEWYLLEITRSPQSVESTLQDLNIVNEKGEKLLLNFLPNQTVYDITVPYGTRWAQVSATRNNVWTPEPTFDPRLVVHTDAFRGNNWLRLLHPNDVDPNHSAISPVTILKVTSYAEDQQLLPGSNKPAYTTTYMVRITRKNPSLNNSIKSLTVKDNADKAIAYENGATFSKDVKEYSLRIPYSLETLTLEALPDDLLAQQVRITLPDGSVVKQKYLGGDTPVKLLVQVPISGKTESQFTLLVQGQSEQGSYTNPAYAIEVFRNPPDTDDTLTSLELFDQDKTPITRFSFNPQTTYYEFSVPFQTEQVMVQPKARSPLARVKVDGVDIVGAVTSHTVFFRPGDRKEIKVEVYPEDRNAQPRVYILNISREQAGADARLKSLKAEGGDPMTPTFIPTNTVYRVNMPEGVSTITFTAVPVSEWATMTINGEAVKSGVASPPYEPLTAQSVVTIVVTAQDGKTTMIYTINVTCQNLLIKSNDAALTGISLDYGVLSPRFRNNILDYEVSVKDEAASIIITPTASDENAKVQVFNGTKELGDYYATYASSLQDGANNFKIKVTAQDNKTIREYNLTVFRKDEEKQGVLKPITADQVNYEQAGNIITIDITKYAVVAADVFNTLKNKYPDKTIVFEGNDYSLEIRGKDIEKLVPYEQVFDFSLSFQSTYEDDIWDLILGEPRNNRVDPVFIQFNHHGTLPGPMRFTISLGRQYRNESATWNYYNQERDRIDFYGGVRTNSRGNFSVLLTHMSTYIYSDYQILGAENKTGQQNVGGVGGGGSTAADNKYNPNTGIG